MPILFEGKYKRARKLQKDRSTAQERGENAPALQEQMEKGDLFAMILAAFLTFLPIALIVLAVLAAAGYFFLLR